MNKPIETPVIDDTTAQPVDVDTNVSEQNVASDTTTATDAAQPVTEPPEATTDSETADTPDVDEIKADLGEVDGIPELDDEQAEADNATTENEENHADITAEAVASIKALIGKQPVEVELGIQRIHDDTGLTKGTIKKQLEAMTPKKNSAEQSSEAEAEPWPDAVDGNALALAMLALINKYMFLPGQEGVQIALWCMGTFFTDSLDLFPKLLIHSPIRGCGKTTLIKILRCITREAEIAANMSPAVAFRLIEKFNPTLLLDEIDAWLPDNEEMRGIVNAGHDRETGYVWRCDGDDHEPRKFGVFCPMALGGIGKQADTIEDRSIKVTLHKVTGLNRPPNFDRHQYRKTEALRRKAARWAKDTAYIEVVAPATYNARQQDNWGPNFSIANMLGGDWPQLCQKAYDVELAKVTNDEGIGERLLADIQLVFAGMSVDWIWSKELTQALADLEDSDWENFGYKGLTAHTMSKYLKEFQIYPEQIKRNNENKRGFRVANFKSAFEIYLPSDNENSEAEEWEDF